MTNNVIADTNGQTDQSLSAIDAAVAAQAARKAAKANESEGGAAAPAAGAEGAKKRTVLTKEERLERAKKIEEDREARKAKKAQEREEKRQGAAAQRGTPHMSKVEKAAAGLAAMDVETEALFNEVKGSLSQPQIDILVAHLSFHSRRSATEGSLAVKLEKGMRVRIISGPSAKLIGKEGVVEKAQRIHCYIAVPGLNKPAYLFNYNVEVLPAAAPAAGEADAPTGEQPSGDAAAA